jgi:hypothetical protein
MIKKKGKNARFTYSTGINQESFIARHQWLTPVILATQEAEIRMIVVQSQPGQIVCKTLFVYQTQKRAGEVAQVVEHLPSKSEALGSNSSTTKKKKKSLLCPKHYIRTLHKLW